MKGFSSVLLTVAWLGFSTSPVFGGGIEAVPMADIGGKGGSGWGAGGHGGGADHVGGTPHAASATAPQPSPAPQPAGRSNVGTGMVVEAKPASDRTSGVQPPVEIGGLTKEFSPGSSYETKTEGSSQAAAGANKEKGATNTAVAPEAAPKSESNARPASPQGREIGSLGQGARRSAAPQTTSVSLGSGATHSLSSQPQSVATSNAMAELDEAWAALQQAKRALAKARAIRAPQLIAVPREETVRNKSDFEGGKDIAKDLLIIAIFPEKAVSASLDIAKNVLGPKSTGTSQDMVRQWGYPEEAKLAESEKNFARALARVAQPTPSNLVNGTSTKLGNGPVLKSGR